MTTECSWNEFLKIGNTTLSEEHGITEEDEVRNFLLKCASERARHRKPELASAAVFRVVQGEKPEVVEAGIARLQGKREKLILAGLQLDGEESMLLRQLIAAQSRP